MFRPNPLKKTRSLQPRRALLAAAFAILAATAVPAHRAAAQTVVDGGSTVNITTDTTYVSLTVGNTGMGTVNQSTGTVTITGSNNAALALGAFSGSNGIYNLSGTGVLNSTSSAPNAVTSGSFAQTGTSTFNASSFQINGTASSYSLGGSGSLNVTNTLVLQNGTYTQTGGTVTLASSASFQVNGGTASLSGGILNSPGNLNYVGSNGGTGTFNLSGGTANFGQLQIGRSPMGTVNQSGTSALTASGGIVLGIGYFNGAGNSTGTGTYNLNGGTLTTTSVSRGATPSTGTLNLNGGTLVASGASTTFVSGLTTANVRGGGALINTNGFNVTVPQALVHSTLTGDAATDGGLTKLGSGTLTLSGANTYTGGTTVSAGTLTAASNTALGTGNVTLAASTQLTLNTGVAITNMTGAILTLANTTSSVVNLLGTGVQDTVNSLVINGVGQPAGTYGAAGSGATFTLLPDFTGTGELQVLSGSLAVPEPSTWAMLFVGAGLLGAGVRRRRRALRLA